MMRLIGVTAMVTAMFASVVSGQVWVGRWEKGAVVAGSVVRACPGDGGTYLQPMINPAGTHVVFWGRTAADNGGRPLDEVRNLSDIFVMKVDGTDFRKMTRDLKTNKDPAWTPDGRIIFTSKRDGEAGPVNPRTGEPGTATHVWLMDADGTNAKRLTTGPFNDGRPCVSPDGKTVVFTSNRSGEREGKLWEMPLEGGEPRQLSKAEGSQARPMWSPDGKRIAYFTTGSVVKRFNLAVMDYPDGEEVQPVDISRGNDNIRGPWWMQDGKHVMVHGRLGGDNPPVAIYMVEVATGKWTKVEVPGSESAGHASLDREEKLISFDGRRAAAQ